MGLTWKPDHKPNWKKISAHSFVFLSSLFCSSFFSFSLFLLPFSSSLVRSSFSPATMEDAGEFSDHKNSSKDISPLDFLRRIHFRGYFYKKWKKSGQIAKLQPRFCFSKITQISPKNHKIYTKTLLVISTIQPWP